MSKNVPKLRFQGFDEEWEEKKFGNLSIISRGLTYKPADVQNSGVRVLRSSNIKEDRFMIYKDDIFVKNKAVNITFVKKGDILITAANGSSRLVGKHAIINETSDNMVPGGFMLVARSSQNYFVNSLMSSPWYSRFIKIFVAGGNGAIGNLKKNDLEEQLVYIPQILEQENIGHFFQQIDKITQSQQRKLDNLKEQKKGVLQMMFI